MQQGGQRSRESSREGEAAVNRREGRGMAEKRSRGDRGGFTWISCSVLASALPSADDSASDVIRVQKACAHRDS